MLSPAIKTKLETLASVGILTFAGTFVGILTQDTIPLTLAAWRAAVLPALATAIAAELVFLRTTIAQALAALASQIVGTTLTTTTSDAVEGVTTTTTAVKPADTKGSP